MSNEKMALTLINILSPTFDKYKCLPVALIESEIDANGLTGLPVAYFARAFRIYTGIELTACDFSFRPCITTGMPCEMFLHPQRVREEYKEGYFDRLIAFSNAWLGKAHKFKSQM